MKKSDHGVEVIKVGNGFTIRDSGGNITVVEETEDDEPRAGEKLLWTLVEFFGLTGSRYDREHIAVIRAAGDKYTPQGDEKIVEEHYRKVVRKKSKAREKNDHRTYLMCDFSISLGIHVFRTNLVTT